MSATLAEHNAWTSWRLFDAGGAWAAASADGAALDPGTRTVNLRLTTTPTSATPLSNTSGQVALELTSLTGYTFVDGSGTDVSSHITATISQQWILIQGAAGGGVNYGPLQLQIVNPLTIPVYLQTASGDAQYKQRDPIYPVVNPPDQTGPTSTVPTNLPVEVVNRIVREKANPGFTCKITFIDRYDLLGVELGNRVNLTISELGIISRGHVVTGVKHHFQGSLQEDRPPSFVLESTFTLEKIPGTLLPGAGTSNSTQDAAGTGGEISAYLTFDDSSSGFGEGDFQP